MGTLYMGTPRVICTWGLFLGIEIQVGKRSIILVATRSAWVGKRSRTLTTKRMSWGRKTVEKMGSEVASESKRNSWSFLWNSSYGSTLKFGLRSGFDGGNTVQYFGSG